MDTSKQIDELLESVGEKIRHESVRIGIQKRSATDSSKPRPVKVTVASSAHAFQIIRAARKLKDLSRYSQVFICPDRTDEERKSRREAVTLMKQKKKDEPNKIFFINRSGQVVTAT